MKRIQNNPFCMIDEMISGILLAHGDRYEQTENPRVLKRKTDVSQERVGLVSGGGSGHEPAFWGFLGENLLDAVALGDVFSSPSPKDFYDAILQADHGKGVLCLCGHFKGDEVNSDIAIRMAKEQGIHVEKVTINDDIAVRSSDEAEEHRTLSGLVFIWKIAGAMANAGHLLTEIKEVLQRVNRNCRSVAVALSSCTIPFVETPNYQIENGFMEFGISLHGNPGSKSVKLESASGIADLLIDNLLSELDCPPGTSIAVLLNGLGTTLLMEQYVIYHEIHKRLQARALAVVRTYVGNYITSLDTNGISLSILKLDDDMAGYLTSESALSGL